MSIKGSRLPVTEFQPLTASERNRAPKVLETWRNTRNYTVTARKHGIQLDRIQGYIIRAERVETYGHS